MQWSKKWNISLWDVVYKYKGTEIGNTQVKKKYLKIVLELMYLVTLHHRGRVMQQM